jgi:hypothetical protein
MFTKGPFINCIEILGSVDYNEAGSKSTDYSFDNEPQPKTRIGKSLTASLGNSNCF